jgi:hypothetical protein
MFFPYKDSHLWWAKFMRPRRGGEPLPKKRQVMKVLVMGK